MSEDDDLKRLRELSAEEKLQLLRHDMMTPISAIRGIAGLLKLIDTKTAKDLPEKFDFMVDSLARSGEQLAELLEIYTGFDN